MKTSIILFAVVLFSQSAFARHSYRTEVCANSKHSFVYTGNYPVGGYYQLINRSAADQAVEVVEKNPEIYTEDEIKNMGNFEVESSEILAKKTQKAEECDSFDEVTTISATKIVISNLTEDQSKVLDLKNGDSLSLRCTEVFSTPNRACEDN